MGVVCCVASQVVASKNLLGRKRFRTKVFGEKGGVAALTCTGQEDGHSTSASFNFSEDFFFYCDGDGTRQQDDDANQCSFWPNVSVLHPTHK